MTQKKDSQKARMLRYFEEHRGEWINGQYFLRTMMFSQYHYNIHCLQNDRLRYAYDGIIEASPFKDEHGFKSYRLIDRPIGPRPEPGIVDKINAMEPYKKPETPDEPTGNAPDGLF